MIELGLAFIGFIVAIYVVGACIGGVLGILFYVGDALKKAYDKLNLFGKVVFFYIPIGTVLSFILYKCFLAFLLLLECIISSKVAIILTCIFLLGIVYVILHFVGWDWEEGNHKKFGVLPLLARFCVLLPFTPVIYVGFYIIQIFRKVFISNSQICWKPCFITGNEVKIPILTNLKCFREKQPRSTRTKLKKDQTNQEMEK